MHAKGGSRRVRRPEPPHATRPHPRGLGGNTMKTDRTPTPRRRAAPAPLRPLALCGAAALSLVLSSPAASAQTRGLDALPADREGAWRGGYDPTADNRFNRRLATLPPAGTPWLVTRTPPAVGSGRVWAGPAVLGGLPPQPDIRWPDLGPQAFGREATAADLVFARVDTTVVAFSPWVRFLDDGNERLELARQQWLREQGYTGGVRTFVNPRTLAQPAPAAAARAMPEPSAVIRRPIDVPATRSREQVRFSLPPGVNEATRARLEASGRLIDPAAQGRAHADAHRPTR